MHFLQWTSRWGIAVFDGIHNAIQRHVDWMHCAGLSTVNCNSNNICWQYTLCCEDFITRHIIKRSQMLNVNKTAVRNIITNSKSQGGCLYSACKLQSLDLHNSIWSCRVDLNYRRVLVGSSTLPKSQFCITHFLRLSESGSLQFSATKLAAWIAIYESQVRTLMSGGRTKLESGAALDWNFPKKFRLADFGELYLLQSLLTNGSRATDNRLASDLLAGQRFYRPTHFLRVVVLPSWTNRETPKINSV